MSRERAANGTNGTNVETGIPGNEVLVPGAEDKRLGKLPAKASRLTLHLADYLRPGARAEVPEATNFWLRRADFSKDTYGNTNEGCCTIASQMHAQRRSERLEQKRTLGEREGFTEAECHRVYRAMTQRLYGGGDTGAYEEDALSNWRNPDLTFRDTKGRPYTIDAYVRVNPKSTDEIRTAMFLAGNHGLKICLNLPRMWASVVPPKTWDVRRRPDGSIDLTGDAMPGSWGGHSMFTEDYTRQGPILVHTWGLADQVITWDAVMAYADESHQVIDSVNAWKRRGAGRLMRLNDLITDVNSVSSIKINA